MGNQSSKDEELRQKICLVLGYDDGIKGRQSVFVLEEDISKILKLIQSEKQKSELAENNRVISKIKESFWFDELTDRQWLKLVDLVALKQLGDEPHRD